MRRVHTFEELRCQTEILRDRIPADLEAQPGTGLNDYFAELQQEFPDAAIRTALWDLMANQTIVLQHPGNTLYGINSTTDTPF